MFGWTPILSAIVSVLPPRVCTWLERYQARMSEAAGDLEEIRLRAERPVQLVSARREGFLTEAGELVHDAAGAPALRAEEIVETARRASRHSVYAFEEELRQGFLTLPGGHRVGLVGRCVVEGGRVRTIDPVSGLNFRLHRQVTGPARPLLPHLASPFPPYVYSTLIISPPGAGKTTLLRDLTRLLSDGEGWGPGAIPPRKIVVVDERSEIAGCWLGVPQLSVGSRTDVLDRCPKAEGIMMALRGMAPDVVVTDEIGRPEDLLALEEAQNAGVAVLATAHGVSWEEVISRPALRDLRDYPYFDRVVLLSRRQGPGTVERVFRPESCAASGSGPRAGRARPPAGRGRSSPSRPSIHMP